MVTQPHIHQSLSSSGLPLLPTSWPHGALDRTSLLPCCQNDTETSAKYISHTIKAHNTTLPLVAVFMKDNTVHPPCMVKPIQYVSEKIISEKIDDTGSDEVLKPKLFFNVT